MSRSDNPQSEDDAAAHSAASESLIDRTFLQQLQAGDDAATQELFERYSQRLVQLAGNHIHPALVKRFDGEDVVQSVFRTFFRRQDAGQLKIEHSQHLWRLLASITLCKTRSHARRHTAEKRNAKTEQAQASHFEFLDQEPAPGDALALWEEIDFVLQGLPERTAEILSARLEGKNQSEIAQELKLSRQTVHRLLSLLEVRLDQRFQRFSPENSEK